MPSATLLRGIGFALCGALFWLMYFDLKDHLRPEPRRLLVAAFVVGNLAALLALGLYRVAGAVGLPTWPGERPLAILLFCVALVGPIEEGAKFAAARGVVFRWRAFDEPIDGLVYASAVAIGFAAFENALFAPQLGSIEQLARALASPLTHSLFAALWGFGAGRAFFRARSRGARFLWQAAPLLAAMLVHGLYDFVILALGATYLAGGLALILWCGMIAHARRVVRARPAGP